MTTQIIPRINPARMSILPVELDRVSTNSVCASRFCWRSEHRQQCRSLRLRLSRFAPLRFALINTRRARTSIAQPHKAPPAFVSILPVDLEACSFGDLYSNLVRRDSDPGKRSVFKTLVGLLFLADEANSLVTHASILVPDSTSSGLGSAASSEFNNPVGSPSILTTFFCHRYSISPASPFDVAHRRSVSRSPAN